MRVLLIEDEPTTAKAIELMLTTEGFNVYSTDLGEEGVDLGKLYDYDIILLDLNLPDMSGFEVLRSLRVSKVKTPILILSGLAGIEDKVRGLGFGADDYLTKPFRVRELMARVEALLRRAAAPSGEPRVLTAGKLAIFLDEHRVLYHEREIRLPPKEFALLAALVKRAGRACTRAELLDLVWGNEVIVDPRNIDVHIRRIRAALEGEPDGSHLIQTVHGVGYRFVPDASEWISVEAGGGSHRGEAV